MKKSVQEEARQIIKNAMDDNGWTVQDLHIMSAKIKASRVPRGSINNWVYGLTKNMAVDQLNKILKNVGKEIMVNDIVSTT